MKLRRVREFGVGAAWPNYLWVLWLKDHWVSLQICRWPNTPLFGWNHWKMEDCCKIESWDLTVFGVMFSFEVEQMGLVE